MGNVGYLVNWLKFLKNSAAFCSNCRNAVISDWNYSKILAADGLDWNVFISGHTYQINEWRVDPSRSQ